MLKKGTIRDWLNKYNKFGPEGLLPQKHKGSECKLTVEQLNEVYKAVTGSPRDYGFNKSNWSMRILKKWIDKTFGVIYAVSSLYDLVHRLGLSMQRPKKQCRNADSQKQIQFMDELHELVENNDESTFILYEDEAIITDVPTSTRKLAPVGQQPIIKTNSKGSRQRRVIFGAVSPENGDVLYSTNEAGDSQIFEDFLK